MKRTIISLAVSAVLCGVVLGYSNEFTPLNWPAEGFKPNYFLFGDRLSKLQVSFKIKIIENTGLYFAYNQQMYWSLWQDSQPMRDVNYNPEFFYRFVINGARSSWLDAGIYEHESNGMEGAASHGWNKVYVRFTDGILIGDDHEIHWTVKAWFPYAMDRTSLDIPRYRGVYEVEFTVRNLLHSVFDRNDLTVRLYPGGPSCMDPLKGGQEITFRATKSTFKPFLPLIVIQFFHGYGENLLDDDKERFVVRAGVGF